MKRFHDTPNTVRSGFFRYPTAFFRVVLLVFAVCLGLSGCVVEERKPKILYSNETQPAPDEEITWREVQPGLSYANVLAGLDDGSRKELLLVKVDPHAFEFKVYHNPSEKEAKSLKKIHQQTGSVLTFNGAFFDEDFKAMGLLQDSESRSHKKINSELMNGVFYVSKPVKGTDEVKAKVSNLQNVPEDKEAFMIQNGPVLIDSEGYIPLTRDTEKLAARTVIGVDQDGNIVLIVLHLNLLNTDNAMSLYQFAHLLKENPLFAPMKLRSVLNLDGGPSTGVVVGGEYLPELNNVQNVVITLPRS